MSNLSQGTALQEFFQWENQSRVEAVAGGAKEKVYFLPLHKVKSYFTANNGRKLEKILTEVFDTRNPPVDSDLILREHTSVFCILLRLGQGKQIEHFARYEELSDRRLPFDAVQAPREFPEIKEDPSFLHRFCEQQILYCVPVFDAHMLHKHFGRQRHLPITSRKSLDLNGPAHVSVITVYGPQNKLLPASSDTETPFGSTFILKTYPKEFEAKYKEEVNSFRNVRHAESIIKFYGSYIHGDDFNILLEYPDRGSLEDYFSRESPPSRGTDIIKFWEGLFSLIKGLKAIHSVRLAHHDVQPENIVIVSNGNDSPSDWQFKFANVGNSSGNAGTTDDLTTNRAGSRSTYAPPESYASIHDDQTDRRSSKITWSADIWALGCIYSEAAMWIADGYKGLLDYRQQRTAETSRVLFKGGDCFHDGKQVLQCVLDAHTNIEDRLRRSDSITKDVLDTMVDEMLWDEDRPNAKALWRKAEMVLSRARKAMSVSSMDEFPRPGSGQSRTLPLPKSPPPTSPLPALPRTALPILSSIAEKQYPPNVEKWRSQIGHLQINAVSRASGPASDIASPTFPSQQTVSTESTSEFGGDIAGSRASWNFGDNSSSMTSPTTQFSSPHISLQDFSKQVLNEGRPRAVQTPPSCEYRSPPKKQLSHLSYSNNTAPASGLFVLPPLSEHPAYSQVPLGLPPEQRWVNTPAPSDSRPPQSASFVEDNRATSRAASHQSSAFSHPSEPAVRPKSQRRTGGFSLFPTRNWSLQRRNSIEKSTTSEDNVPRSLNRSSISSSTPSLTALPDHHQSQSPSFEYLSLNTCLEWKKAHKKVKKSSKVQIPPLPGAHMLEDLKGRDHIFIIDDSASMAHVWPDVKRVFETLSYVVKGMSPGGTELFFTVSYDTYRRKDTSDLCEFMENKMCKGETNISYRLNLQLQSHRLKLSRAKGLAQSIKDGAVRPQSFYILTNGEWGEGADPKIGIKSTADFLIAEGLGNKSQVTIEFISFATTAMAMQKINDLAQMDFGLDIVDCTRWTGNVLKMLKGPMDKALWDHEHPNMRNNHAPMAPSHNPTESAGTLVFARDVINELA